MASCLLSYSYQSSQSIVFPELFLPKLLDFLQTLLVAICDFSNSQSYNIPQLSTLPLCSSPAPLVGSRICELVLSDYWMADGKVSGLEPCSMLIALGCLASYLEFCFAEDGFKHPILVNILIITSANETYHSLSFLPNPEQYKRESTYCSLTASWLIQKRQVERIETDGQAQCFLHKLVGK